MVVARARFAVIYLGYRNDYSGQVLFDGHDTRAFRTSQWTDVRKSHVSLLFQELRLFPELTAWENVEIKNRLTSHTAAETIRRWFDMLGIGDKKDALIGEMSYGQQQRVALMRALVQPYDFIVLDEPISHLDDQNAAIMGEIVMDEARRQGAGVIMTSIGKHIPLNYEKTVRL